MRYPILQFNDFLSCAGHGQGVAIEGSSGDRMGDLLPPKRQAVVERLGRRLEYYRRHRDSVIPRYDLAESGSLDQTRQETLLMRQRFLESKAAKKVGAKKSAASACLGSADGRTVKMAAPSSGGGLSIATSQQMDVSTSADGHRSIATVSFTAYFFWNDLSDHSYSVIVCVGHCIHQRFDLNVVEGIHFVHF